MDAKGRNGWFKVKTLEVVRNHQAELLVGLYSCRQGDAPPVAITGSIEEIQDLHDKLGDAITKAITIDKPHLFLRAIQ